MKNRPFSRILAVLLALATPCAGWAQTVSVAPVPAGLAQAGVVGAAAAAGVNRTVPLSAPGFLSALNVHLDATAVRLALPAPAAATAVYLTRAALATAPAAAARSEGAEAARFIAAVLADPAARHAAAAALRAQGELGVQAAEKLEKLGPAAEGLSSLRRLQQDFRTDTGGSSALSRLEGFYSGSKSSPEGTAVPASAPEDFLAGAGRLFHPGLENGEGAVVYRKQGVRPEGAVADDAQVYDQLKVSPLTNAERERAIVELFQKAGAKQEEIVLQNAGRGHNNVYVIKKGRTDRVVVVGSHHDKVEGDGGYGVIDNWTGATMVINLYQAMRDMDTEATYVFAAFAREEEGLLGSAAYLEALSKGQKLKIDSNLNLDTLAVDGTYSWKNNSTKSLLELIKRVAGEEKHQLTEVNFWGGDADSSSFRRFGIPAMTLFGASESVIWDCIHGVGDNIKAVSLPHYRNAYLLSLALLKRLDANPVRPLERFARWAAGAARHIGAYFHF
ncbi:MAG: M28 family peptidase [Elusimicrobiota bacterium]|jgi:hypothetical protein